MNTQNDGGPAWPCEAPDEALRTALIASRDHTGLSLQSIVKLSSKHPGMSLRDWFAGQALAGLQASPDTTDATYDQMAENAYGAADAMIAWRNKKTS